MEGDIKINTGEVRKIALSLLSSVRIIYSGMPNENVFAVSVFEHELGGGNSSSVIYYPKKSTTIYILEYRFKVNEATPNHIILTPL